MGPLFEKSKGVFFFIWVFGFGNYENGWLVRFSDGAKLEKDCFCNVCLVIPTIYYYFKNLIVHHSMIIGKDECM